MRLNSLLPLPLLVVLGGATPVLAQTPMGQEAATCSAPAELPAELQSWRSPVPLKAGVDRKTAAKAMLTAGQAVTLALSPTPKIAYPVRPAKPGGSVSYGGLASLTVAQAGTWRVALGSGAWVDVVKDGEAATSIAHGHGPDCSGVRKMVDYSLEPGTYTIQVAANGSDSLTLLVTRLP
ncbi:hypothetical protein [Sphingobium sp. YR768]|jgi:hypothetical protein|uniref:hypothetical protein n=1 Tax=Sphingobium sp. YR768 TaxID=1884365 RepID=UPI0008AC0738|nr:hypothetical protein [Sphingobium sp. YR768]SER43152.1 hypothetical protein SAMN05518866_1116 [Sphingobium sp. YR768]